MNRAFFREEGRGGAREAEEEEEEGLTGGTESAAAREGPEAKDWVGGMPEGRGERLGGSNSSANGGRLRRWGLWAKRFL
jgi:hypothetical protein